MRVIIVDDEPKAIELLTSYMAHFSYLEVVNTFRNGLKALEFLNKHTVDVVFLDINMPHLSGLSLSKMISPKTAIVFTTAYSEHALESYDVDAVDYLLKPINLERFSKTITKLIDKFEPQKTKTGNEDRTRETLFVKSGLETHQLNIDEIDYLKKDGNYIYYFVGERKIMARQNIAEVLGSLNDDFIQVQKSFIVNFRKISSLTVDHVIMSSVRIPIGSQFKSSLQSKIDNV